MDGISSIGSLAGLALLVLTSGCTSRQQCQDCIAVQDDLRDTSFMIPLSSVRCIDWEHQSFSLNDEYASAINTRIRKNGSRGYHATLTIRGEHLLDFDFYVYGSSYGAPKEGVSVSNYSRMRTFLPGDGWLTLGDPNSNLSAEQFDKLFSASVLSRYRELGVGIVSNWNCAVQDTAPEKHPASYDTLYTEKFQRVFYPTAD